MEENNEFNKEAVVSDDAERGNGREWVSKLRYSRSFMAKLILSDDKIKEFFAGLSNALLSYERTRTSRSRSGEGFFYGRIQFARLAFSGKTLCLYLSVDPALQKKGKYKFIDVSRKKKYAFVPAKLKIRSAGAYRYALSVVEKTFSERGYLPRKKPLPSVVASDFPFEPFETLLARDLIRIILPKAPVETPEEPLPETVPEKNSPVGWVNKLRYSRSFLAKLILSEPKVKEFYAALATKLLSYDKVKSHLSWSGIGFSCGRTSLAKVNFAGKTLCLFLAVDPSAYKKGKYVFSDVSKVKKYASVPAKIKLRSGRALAFVLEVIDSAMKERGLSLRDPALLPVQAKDFPTDSFDNLLARGLIRLIRTTRKEISRKVSVGSIVSQDEEAEEKVLTQGEDKVGDLLTAQEAETAGEEVRQGEGDALLAQQEEGEKVVYLYGERPEGNADAEIVKALSEESYKDTVLTNQALIGRHEEYDVILSFLKHKTADVKLIKKYVVKTIDEKWVCAIEDCLNALDDCLRKPSHFIEETEELLPIERTKKVTPRSIRHLCEHTDLIAKATDDEIIPTHLLNVFRDDSMMTYENKFLNTLLHRLYVFVNDRYNQALRNGANEKVSVLSVSDNFVDGPIRGKINFTLELSEPHGENVRNSVKTKDLWRRVVKLRGIVGDYFKSELAVNLGNAFIRPPVIRTNAILKNPYLRECLGLWEFIESYEDEGNGIVTEESVQTLSDEHIDMIYHGLAEQYLVLRYATAEKAAFIGGRQWNANVADRWEEKTVFGTEKSDVLEPENDEGVLFAVEVAVSADMYIDQLGEEEQQKRQKEREELLALTKKEQDKTAEEEKPEVVFVGSEELPVGETPEQKPEEEAEEEEEKAESEDEKEEAEEEGAQPSATGGPVVRYRKSFEAKLRLAGEDTKEFYCDIYNAFLSKNKVRAREGYSSVSFLLGRRMLAKAAIVGRTLRLYFAIDPSTLDEKYRVKDCSDVKRFVLTPTMMKVRSGRSLKQALALVEIVCAGLDENKNEFVKAEVSRYGAETVERMVEMGLVQKYVTDVPVTFGPTEEKKKVDLSGADGDALIPQKEAMSDKEIKLTLDEKEKKEKPIVRIETTEPAGGDALNVKPITLEEILAYETNKKQEKPVVRQTEEEKQPTPEKKESLWNRLFKRKK